MNEWRLDGGVRLIHAWSRTHQYFMQVESLCSCSSVCACLHYSWTTRHCPVSEAANAASQGRSRSPAVHPCQVMALTDEAVRRRRAYFLLAARRDCL